MTEFTDKIIEYAERCILILIMALTIGGVFFELYVVYEKQKIELADLLLLFIYAEVIAMVGVFLRSNVLPVVYPIFIAITALSRLIILQGKDMDPINIFYEAISIFVLALAVVIIKSSKINKIAEQLVGHRHKEEDSSEKNNGHKQENL